MENKLIGLELAYRTTNYGAQLQAFATQQVIERMGFTTRIFNHAKQFSLASHNFGPGILYNAYLNMKTTRIRKNTRVDISDEAYLQNRDARKKSSQQFIQDRLKGVTHLLSYGELVKVAETMKAVIIGSDQKWTPGFCYQKINSLNFAPKGVRRISYATSLGVSAYPGYCRFLSKRMWERIDFLSVREKQGAIIIKDICGDIPVEVVVDPTYLLTKDEWEVLVPPQKMLDTPYVFCYFLGNNDESKKSARRFADKHNLKLVSVLSDESYSPYDQVFADELVKGASPEDFINWIRGAEYVFTDSFHGTAFSVINGRQFFVFYRKRPDAKLNRNSRIDNILALWQIPDRLLTDDVDWDSFHYNSIDYGEVNLIVAQERERSLGYLTKALSFNENK